MKRYYSVVIAALVCLLVIGQVQLAEADWQSDWENNAIYTTVGAVVISPDGAPVYAYTRPGMSYEKAGQLDNGQQIWTYSEYKGWTEITFDKGNEERVAGYVLTRQIVAADLEPVADLSDAPDFFDWDGQWTAILNGYRIELNVMAYREEDAFWYEATFSCNNGYYCIGTVTQIDPWHLSFDSEGIDFVIEMNSAKNVVSLGYMVCRDDNIGDIVDDPFFGSIMLSRSNSEPGNENAVGYRFVQFQDDSMEKPENYLPSFTTEMFLQDSCVFHEDVAKLAVLLASNAYNLDEYDAPGDQIVEMYHDLGIDNSHIMLFNYQGHPLNVREDPISADMDEFSIASRGMGEYELLLITLRGSGQIGLSPDWIVNFGVGELKRMDAWVQESFWFYMEKVYDGISRYIWEHPEIRVAMESDRLKVLITGHSRGGAAANLLGAYLMDNLYRLENPVYAAKMDDTFVYTFACPRDMRQRGELAPNKTNCGNIFNIVIDYDIVPKFPKSLLVKMKRYGTTYTYETTYKELGDNNFDHHKPDNYITAVFNHDYIRMQAEEMKTVIVSNDP